MSDFSECKSNVKYIEEVQPLDAWRVLADEDDSFLIDVRTNFEVSYIGYPQLVSLQKETIFVPWRKYPTMDINQNFVKDVEANLPDISKNSKLFFICRVGGRSLEAAKEMAQHGYKSCYNVTGGFEGDLDVNGHRSNIEGWKKDKLPWEQR